MSTIRIPTTVDSTILQVLKVKNWSEDRSYYDFLELTDELIEERKIYIEERKKFLGKIITQAEELLNKDDC